MRTAPFPSLRVGLVALSALVAGCSPKPGTGGLEVTVALEPGLISRCVKVTATDGTTTKETKPMAVGTKTSLQVAIYSDGFESSVTVQALGYVDVECTMLSGEASEPADGTFGNPAKSLTLTVGPSGNGDGGFNPDGGPDAGRDAGTDAGVDAGVDAGLDAGIDNDNDGSPLPADCDDTNPAIRPGALEVCDNALDDDCDSLSDCQQPVCNTFRCSPTGFCMNNVCAGSLESPCNDGLDNDNDSRIDCADSDCVPGSMCSDSNSCTTGDVCGADGGCEKTGDVMCTTPPNGGVCYGASGLCLPDAGASCQYTALTGGTCDDLLGCTTGDTCTAGSCGGTAVSCPVPTNACLSPVGTCQEPSGLCFNPPRPMGTGTCSDGLNCTINDTCDGDGGCAGTMVPCTTPPSQCHSASTGCDGAGACIYGNRNGGPCDAGAGLGAATCDLSFNCNVTPSSTFLYAPSNFAEAQLATDGGFAMAVTSNRTLDTDAPNVTVGTMPPFTVITPDGGQPTVLIRVTGLSVSPGVTLTISGARPVIFAVLGDAVIDGIVKAANPGSPAACGHGANGDSGGGGGFGTAGGAGARPNGSAGIGGVLNGAASLTPIRGGCHGGTGPAAAGNGGGSIQISASGTLTINDTITAPGLGGAGNAASSNNGGGGGGSGGAILVEANLIVLNNAKLTANGGGGGGGSDNAIAPAGAPGSENSDTPAAGGAAGGPGGGRGGDGATRTSGPGAGTSVNSNDGAGGGGGAVGRIRIRAASCTVSGTQVISPQANTTGTMCPN